MRNQSHIGRNVQSNISLGAGIVGVIIFLFVCAGGTPILQTTDTDFTLALVVLQASSVVVSMVMALYGIEKSHAAGVGRWQGICGFAMGGLVALGYIAAWILIGSFG